MKFWSAKFAHETETEWKIGLVWIQHLEFFQKPILHQNLEKISTWAQDGCLRLDVGFSRLRNQNFTSIEIREKMEALGEKLKTHVSEISSGSQARN